MTEEKKKWFVKKKKSGCCDVKIVPREQLEKDLNKESKETKEE